MTRGYGEVARLRRRLEQAKTEKQVLEYVAYLYLVIEKTKQKFRENHVKMQETIGK